MVEALCAVLCGPGEEDIDHDGVVWVLGLRYQANLIARCRLEQTECRDNASLGVKFQVSLFSFSVISV